MIVTSSVCNPWWIQSDIIIMPLFIIIIISVKI